MSQYPIDKIDGVSDETMATIKNNYEVLPNKIKQLHKAVLDSLDLSEFNIHERALASSNMSVTWVTKHHTEQALLKKMTNKLEELEEGFIEQYGKKDIPRYVTVGNAAKDETINKLKASIAVQEDVVRYLAETCKIIKEDRWNISNAINIMQMDK